MWFKIKCLVGLCLIVVFPFLPILIYDVWNVLDRLYQKTFDVGVTPTSYDGASFFAIMITSISFLAAFILIIAFLANPEVE